MAVKMLHDVTVFSAALCQIQDETVKIVVVFKVPCLNEISMKLLKSVVISYLSTCPAKNQAGGGTS